MEVEEVDEASRIIEYLKSKGYHDAARSLESNITQVLSASQLAEAVSNLNDQRIVNVVRTGSKGLYWQCAKLSAHRREPHKV